MSQLPDGLRGHPADSQEVNGIQFVGFVCCPQSRSVPQCCRLHTEIEAVAGFGRKLLGIFADR